MATNSEELSSKLSSDEAELASQAAMQQQNAEAAQSEVEEAKAEEQTNSELQAQDKQNCELQKNAPKLEEQNCKR